MRDDADAAAEPQNRPEGESMADWLKAADNLKNALSHDEVVWVPVVQVTRDDVLVDVGEKLDGIVSKNEFESKGLPAPGETIAVIIEKRGRGDHPTRLSHAKALAKLGWEKAERALQSKEILGGKVLRQIKGGYLVDMGLSAFLPLSLAMLRPAGDSSKLVGRDIRFRIIELDRDRNKAVISRKAVLEEEEKERKAEVLKKIHVGQILDAKIISLVSFGAFADIGGIEGLIHLSDIAWMTPRHPKDVLQPSQKVKVKVLAIDPELQKISLGLKQLQPNPADMLRKKFPKGTKVSGQVRKVSAKGVEVSLAGGTRGFAASSELAEGEICKVGDTMVAITMGVNDKTFELLLSPKQFQHKKDRERVRQYLKGAPPLTLGDLLKGDE